MGRGKSIKKRKLEYKRLCEGEKREESERWERKAVEAKRARDV